MGRHPLRSYGDGHRGRRVQKSPQHSRASKKIGYGGHQQGETEGGCQTTDAPVSNLDCWTMGVGLEDRPRKRPCEMGGTRVGHLTEWPHSVRGYEEPALEMQHRPTSPSYRHGGAWNAGGAHGSIQGSSSTDEGAAFRSSGRCQRRRAPRRSVENTRIRQRRGTHFVQIRRRGRSNTDLTRHRDLSERCWHGHWASFEIALRPRNLEPYDEPHSQPLRQSNVAQKACSTTNDNVVYETMSFASTNVVCIHRCRFL